MCLNYGCVEFNTTLFFQSINFVVSLFKNQSVSLGSTLVTNEKIEHYKDHKSIVLWFWVKSSVNALCGWIMKPPL